MIGVDKGDSKFDNPYQYGSTSTPSTTQPQPQAGSSSAQGQRNDELPPPPPFDSQRRNGGSVIIESIYEPEEEEWVPFGGEQPPEFTPYRAQHWVTGDGDVVSHDSHLNEDGTGVIQFFSTFSYHAIRLSNY
ncbi:hypothetical protein FRC19_007810 [Serendipita sp. 401]|nr:hypothetical protein FRC19_007810 [Serendipita sp. 401]